MIAMNITLLIHKGKLVFLLHLDLVSDQTAVGINGAMCRLRIANCLSTALADLCTR